MTIAPYDRVTHNGNTLYRRDWDLLAYCYRQINETFDYDNSVGQGSWSNGANSAGTHSGAGAADLRIRLIPQIKWVSLAVLLRSWSGCAWVRSEDFGNWTATGPHIHVIFRDDPGLAPGAQQQVDDYDAGRNGLAGGGPDYHARPVQRRFPQDLPPPIEEDDDMPIILVKGRQNKLLSGARLAPISPTTATALVKVGVKKVSVPLADWPALEKAFGGQ
jgi:hypothetical protein